MKIYKVGLIQASKHAADIKMHESLGEDYESLGEELGGIGL